MTKLVAITWFIWSCCGALLMALFLTVGLDLELERRVIAEACFEASLDPSLHQETVSVCGEVP